MKINGFNCTIYHVTKENGHKIRLNCNGNCWNSSTLIFFLIFLTRFGWNRSIFKVIIYVLF